MIRFIGYALFLMNAVCFAQDCCATNPIIFADVPDMSIIRIDSTYYMSSTTMHMNPGVPVMKSYDLTNWSIISYAYTTLVNTDETNLSNGKNEYGRGSWASCLRYHNGYFYLSTFSHTTNKTYIFKTTDIENGKWEQISFAPAYHDHTLFFDDDGKIYIIWGVGRLYIAELEKDLAGIKKNTERVLIDNASAPAGTNIMLPAEGSQLFKVNGMYYLFNITWPVNGMRTVIVHRASNIFGPYEGRIGLQDRGIAQGGLIETKDGRWFAYLFRDYGAVGRIPYLVPVRWHDGWPVLGVDGNVPDTIPLPPSKGILPGIVASDNFDRNNDASLPLVWQWNHNTLFSLWSLSERKGYLRLRTGRIDNNIFEAKNILTQRTFGPGCVATTVFDVRGMKEGDVAGLALFQRRYGYVGILSEKQNKWIIMVSAESDTAREVERISLKGNIVYFKAECDFKNMADTGWFSYSLDGKQWKKIGSTIKMTYTLPHFMGYRFALFNYATRETGGYVDLDFFSIKEKRE